MLPKRLPGNRDSLGPGNGQELLSGHGEGGEAPGCKTRGALRSLFDAGSPVLVKPPA